LAVRLNNPELARSAFMAAMALELTDDEKAMVADEVAHVTEAVHQT
jgi:hypothetical protein